MSNKIVTKGNVKVGDKVIYTEAFLKIHRSYLNFILRNGILYHIVTEVYSKSISTNWVNYKGIVKMHDITNQYKKCNFLDEEYNSFEFFDPENIKYLKDE